MKQVPAAAFSLLYETPIQSTRDAFDKLNRGEVVLLAFSGRMASGKDTLAPKVMETLGFMEHSFHEFFAKALRQEVDTIIELIREHSDQESAVQAVSVELKALANYSRTVVEMLWPEVKSGIVRSAYDRTATMRSILQYWGTDYRRKYDEDYWVKISMDSIIRELAGGRSVFVTDQRFENEVNSVQRAGGYSVRLKVSRPVQIQRLIARDGVAPKTEALDHPSESALDAYEEQGKFSITVDTDPLSTAQVLEKILIGIEHDLMLAAPSSVEKPRGVSLDRKSFFVQHEREPIILAVDLDEVCFDYLGGIRKRLEAKGYVIPPGKNTSWSLMKSGWLESEEEYKRLHAEAVLDGLYLGLDILPETRETMQDLSDSGYELNIITSRFVIPGQHEIVVRETAEALDAGRLPYSNLMFQRNKARFLADAYLEDGPHNIEALRKAGRYVIKMNQLYNMYLGGPEANNWREARQLLRERFGR